MMSPEPGHAMVVAEQQERVVGFAGDRLAAGPAWFPVARGCQQ